MNDFDLVTPSSLDEALALLDTDDPTVRPLSGGTGLMLMMKSGVFEPSVLVNLAGLDARYRTIEATPEGGVRVGAMASLSDIEHSTDMQRVAPVACRAMKRLANVRVRNVARIGGNLAHGDPHMDMPPVLAALGGKIGTAGPNGRREIPIEALFAGYYETVLEQGEIIAEVVLPPQKGWRTVYRKCTTRTHDDWPTLGVAVSLRLDGGAVEESRIMVSAATEKLTRIGEAEALLAGRVASDIDLLRRTGEAAAEAVETIDDARGSSAYKKELVRVEIRRALEELLAEDCSR